MTVFLTSNPTGEDRKFLLDKNGWIEALTSRWKPDARCLLAASDPENVPMGEEMRDNLQAAFENSGLPVSAFDIWDGRCHDFSAETLGTYDVVVLGGGHVPTQNAFFRQIGLKESLQTAEPGIVIGISAGSMNAAEIVYSQPELPGESVDPDYQRFLPGLGLTNVNILPHYQAVKDEVLDGKRLFQDITYPDSMGHCFYAIPDGSYLLREGNAQAIFGEAWRISDAEISRFCEEGESRDIPIDP